MKTLTYWKIENNNDCDCYAIRTKTKKEALEQKNKIWNSEDYANEIIKIEIPYEDKFELMKNLYNDAFDGAYAVKTYKIK